MVMARRIGQSTPCADSGPTPDGFSMKLLFRMNWSLRRAALEDLDRPHKFALERIRFVSIRAAATSSELMIIAESYASVADENYVRDAKVGARINGVSTFADTAEFLRQARLISLNQESLSQIFSMSHPSFLTER